MVLDPPSRLSAHGPSQANTGRARVCCEFEFRVCVERWEELEARQGPGFLASSLVGSSRILWVCARVVRTSLITRCGTRYYVLVAACVLARKAEWLRNACLAAALLFPAVAAIHGVVLAALHVDGELSSAPRPLLYHAAATCRRVAPWRPRAS